MSTFLNNNITLCNILLLQFHLFFQMIKGIHIHSPLLTMIKKSLWSLNNNNMIYTTWIQIYLLAVNSSQSFIEIFFLNTKLMIFLNVYYNLIKTHVFKILIFYTFGFKFIINTNFFLFLIRYSFISLPSLISFIYVWEHVYFAQYLVFSKKKS